MANHVEFERLIGEITTRLDVLEDEVDRLRDFRHNFPQTVIGEIQLQFFELRQLIEATKQMPMGSDDRHVTRKELGILIGLMTTCALAGASFALWVIQHGKVTP